MRSKLVSPEVIHSANLIDTIVFPFQPLPASRPRFRVIKSKGGKQFVSTYHAGPYKEWLKSAEEHLDKHYTDASVLLLKPLPILVVVSSVLQKARTSKLEYPRGDVDNFAKGPLDAVTTSKGGWDDDNQILYLLTSKRFCEPEEAPHTKLEIYAI